MLLEINFLSTAFAENQLSVMREVAITVALIGAFGREGPCEDENKDSLSPFTVDWTTLG